MGIFSVIVLFLSLVISFQNCSEKGFKQRTINQSIVPVEQNLEGLALTPTDVIAESMTWMAQGITGDPERHPDAEARVPVSLSGPC